LPLMHHFPRHGAMITKSSIQYITCSMQTTTIQTSYVYYAHIPRTSQHTPMHVIRLLSVINLNPDW
jgi:hypothetical protein